MQIELPTFNQQVNYARYRGQPGGHYESYFLRANHPTRPLAFWIRYTIFSPKNHPEKALGELWSVFFDGETCRHTAARQAYPLSACRFEPSTFNVQVGTARLGPDALQGSVALNAAALTWDLTYAGSSAPLFLLPANLYQAQFPAAKSLVSLPMAHFNGTFIVNTESIRINDWVGSQNHNWGTRHTDLYAWGQVAGCDTHPDSFLEVATARLRFGPFWTPPLTPLVLRHGDKEYAITDMLKALRSRGRFGYFTWEFSSDTPEVEIHGVISAPANAFIGLNYLNPPGGSKDCLNSKIASCRLQLKHKATGRVELLETSRRAAFEILTSDHSHGIPIAA